MVPQHELLIPVLRDLTPAIDDSGVDPTASGEYGRGGVDSRKSRDEIVLDSNAVLQEDECGRARIIIKRR